MTPEGWVLTTVGQLGAPGKPAIKAGPFGSALKKEFYVPSGFKVYGQEQVIAKDPFFGDYYIDESKYLELSSCAVEPGDILLSLVGTVGKVLLLPEGSEPGIINPRLLRLSLDKRRVHGPFMAHYLESDLVVNRLESWAQGGTMGVLNARLVRDLPVLLPPLPEQHQIARVLDTWDTAIRAVEKVAAAKRERKRGLMQLLLTGKKRFTEYAHLAWRSAPLADYVASARKGKPASLNDAGRGVPYIGSAAFNGDYTSHTDDPSAVRCSAKDVLLLWDGEYAGKSTTGHVGAVGSTVVAITLKPGLDNVYLHNLLLFHNQRIRSVREGSGIPHMPSDFFTWFKPQLPPIEEQRTIASVLSTADEELRMLEAQLEAYELQKRGLMQQLLTGEKRVNADVPEAVPA